MACAATTVTPTVSTADANAPPPVSLASTGAAGNVAVSAAMLDKHASNNKTASDSDEITGQDEEQNEEDGEKVESSVGGKTAAAETNETAVVTQGKTTKQPAKNGTETTKKTFKQTSLSLDSSPGNTAETKVPAKETAVPVSTKTAPAASEKPASVSTKTAPAASEKPAAAKTRGERIAKAAHATQ